MSKLALDAGFDLAAEGVAHLLLCRYCAQASCRLEVKSSVRRSDSITATQQPKSPKHYVQRRPTIPMLEPEVIRQVLLPQLSGTGEQLFLSCGKIKP